MTPRLTVPDLGTILAIWAHPDDETYLAGGLMAAAVTNGQRVICVSATAGEHGTDDPQVWPPDRLGRTRRWEAAAAMAVLGVSDHRWLGYTDGTLADLDPAGPVERIRAIIAAERPDTVVTFGPDGGGTFHPDHLAVSRWVRAAWHRAGHRGRLLLSVSSEDHVRTWAEQYEKWEIFMTDDRPVGVPDAELAVRLRLAGGHLDQKIAALLAMHTQTASAQSALGWDTYRAVNEEECFVAVGQR
jgi:LmbE family N-acetylglucosaminyl deacetylase